MMIREVLINAFISFTFIRTSLCVQQYQQYGEAFNWVKNVLVYILMAFLLVGLCFIYFFYIKPKRMISYYCRQLEHKGYRVYKLPFQFLGMPFYEMLYKDYLNHNDCFHSLKELGGDFDFIVTNLLSSPYIASCNYEFAKKIYGTEHHYDFIKNPQAFALIGKYFQQGLVLSEGEGWKKKKKVLAKILNFDFIKQMIPDLVDICNQTYDGFEKQFMQLDQEKAVKVDIRILGLRMFHNIIVSKFLGKEFMQKKVGGKEFYKAIYELVRMSGQLSLHDNFVSYFGPWIVKLKMRKEHRQIEDLNKSVKFYVEDFIKQKQKQFNTKTQVEKANSRTILESFMHFSEKDNVKFSQRSLCNELQAFVIAGVDNMASIFTSTLYMIFSHQQVYATLKRLIATLIKQDKDINYENLRKMEYLDFIINETLRLYSSTGFTFDRVAVKSKQIDGVKIQKGTIINYLTKCFGFNAKYFPDPHKFSPERWQSKQNNFEMQAAISLQFGLGPRTCIGKQFSLIELKVSLVKFVMRYKNFRELKERKFRYGAIGQFEFSEVSFEKNQ